MSGGCYTWSYKQEHPTLEKLDRVLMSSDWEDLYPLVSVKILVKEISDHNPLLLDGGVASPRTPGSRCFKFDNAWLNNPEFLPLVAAIWAQPVYTSDPIDVLNIKLKRIKNSSKDGDQTFLVGIRLGKTLSDSSFRSWRIWKKKMTCVGKPILGS